MATLIRALTCAPACLLLLTAARAQGPSIEGRLQIVPQWGGYGDHVRFVDVDGDGRRDMLRGGDDGNTSYVRLEVDAGNFALRIAYNLATQEYVIASALASGDIDGDGDRDIVYSRLGPSIAIVLGSASGAFTDGPSFTVLSTSYAIDLVDVDGDGDLDLLIAGYDTDQLHVRLNDGHGVFVGGTPATTGAEPSGMAVGDIDADGDVDVVTADSEDDTVSVLLGLGNGLFAPRVIHGVGHAPEQTLLVDVDGDGDRDLVVANRGAASISVLLNLGGGAFGPASTFATGAECRFIDVADLNGDGVVDIAATNGAAVGGISVLFGTGGGSFAPFVTKGAGPYAQIAALDLDRDGDLDLAVVGGMALLNRGDGTFSLPASEPIGSGSSVMEVGDLDGDGDDDLAMISNNSVATRANLGGGVFGPPVSTPVAAPSSDLRLADLDGDGDLDAATSSYWIGPVVVLTNPGNGTLVAPVYLTPSVNTYRVALVDVNGNNLPDVVVRDGTQFLAATNLGGGSFTPFATISAQSSPIYTWDDADFDGDGITDFISAGQTNIYFHRNAGTGTLGPAIPVASGGPFWRIVAGDLDGDGDADLVVTGGGGVRILLNSGAASFGPPTILGGQVGQLSIVDLDHDGDRDILCVAYGNLFVFDNLGGATFAPPVLAGAAGADDMSPVDVDLDGDEDLVGSVLQQFFVLENRTASGSAYCAGDGSATACPCGNGSTPGSNAGCLNSGGRGGKLSATGSTSLASDTLRLHGTGMTNSSVLYFQGTLATNGGAGAVFGDGLRCTGGSVIRLDVEHNIAGASVSPGAGDPSLRALGQVTAPGVRFYQAWYRDAQAFCTSATSNLTNGLRIVWRL